jgi:hypothetical protein
MVLVYFILVGTTEISSDMPETDYSSMHKRYKKLLKKYENYPTFGEHVAGNYTDDKLLEYFIMFTKKFPMYTFNFYYFYASTVDYKWSCNMWNINKNSVHDYVKNIDMDIKLNVNKFHINSKCSIDNIYVKNSITEIFSDGYWWNCIA